MTTWQEDLQEDRRIARELHQYRLDNLLRMVEIKSLINRFDKASSDIHKLELAGRLINLVQKVML